MIDASLSQSQIEAIDIFFNNIGLVFQIVDDILDVEGNFEELGKPIGSDKENSKSTFVTIYGLEESKNQARKLTYEANDILKKQFGDKANKLIEFSDKLVKRKK